MGLLLFAPQSWVYEFTSSEVPSRWGHLLPGGTLLLLEFSNRSLCFVHYIISTVLSSSVLIQSRCVWVVLPVCLNKLHGVQFPQH